MLKRSSKSEDLNEAAFRVVSQATDDVEPDREVLSAAAAALGRRGGLKGGKARAARLSAAERSEIASKAAMARWQKAKRVRAR